MAVRLPVSRRNDAWGGKTSPIRASPMPSPSRSAPAKSRGAQPRGGLLEQGPGGVGGQARRRGVARRRVAAESPPGLGRPAAKGPELAVDLAPEVIQAVAVQVGRLGPVQSQDRVPLLARRALQDVDNGTNEGTSREDSPQFRGGRAADRDGQHRPAVRTAAPPAEWPGETGTIRRVVAGPGPERMAVLARERVRRRLAPVRRYPTARQEEAGGL